MNEQVNTRKNLIMFPLGTVGRDMMYNLFTNFLLTYVLFTRRLDAAQLAGITAIMVAARVFDAFNDPIMGNIIERTRTRWGKFKPWIVIGIALTCIVVYTAFNTNLQGWNFVCFFGVIYFLYSITYTMHDISYWGMIPSLGTDPHVRNQFTSRATLCAGIGGALAGFLIPRFTTGAGTLGGNASYAFGRIALVVCILAPLFLCFTIFGVRENRDYNKHKAPPVSFKKIVGTIAGNDQLLWIALIFLIQQIGNGLALGGLGSTYLYFELGYEGGYYSNFSTFGLAATAVLMIFYPSISKRINRKPLMGIMTVVSAVGYVVMLAVAMLVPSSNPGLKCWLFTVGYMAANFGQYSFYLIMMISILNTVEYNEFKTGERDEAIIASLRPFLTKMASAFIAIITYASYMLFGVISYTNQISDLEQQTSMGLITEADKLSQIGTVIANVQSGQRFGLLMCITVVPFIFMLVSYLLYKKHYNLDEEYYDEICAKISSARESE